MGQLAHSQIDARGYKPLLVALLAVSAVITLASAISLIAMSGAEGEAYRWIATFHQLVFVGRELSAATWFASALWLLLAFLAFLAGILAESQKGYWFFFGTIAATASMDETATLHEKFYAAGGAIRQYIPFDIFSYSWVIVGVIIAVTVAIVLFPFVLRLPRPAMIGILVGGAIFLFGAIVLETLGGHAAAQYGDTSWQLYALMHVEEFCEYVGVTIACYALSGMVHSTRRGGVPALVFSGYRENADGS